MKKIGIITIQKVDNYGAELQSFALYFALQQKGYDVEMIDYLYIKHPKHISQKVSSPYASFSLKEKIKATLLKKLAYLFPLYRKKIYQIKHSRFQKFYRQMKYSKTFRSYTSLYQAKFNYDVYMVGSDQVWNPATMSSISPYFLTFAPHEAKKIAYASSFGVSSIPEYLTQQYAAGLNNLATIACREETGVKLIQQLSGKNATHVLDPTLLLNKKDWLTIMQPYFTKKNDDKYIFVYTVKKDPRVIEFATLLKKQTGWKIYEVKARHIAKKTPGVDLTILDAGPAEFVELCNYAAFIVTNSFHGTVFSVNLNKPFYTVLSKESTNNSRQIDLLQMLGLKNRIVFSQDDFAQINITMDVNFNEANQHLENARKKSFDYLNSAIN
jgi:hypothetical protein